MGKLTTITLPKGTRIEIIDNDNLDLEIGTKATLAFDENIQLGSYTNSVLVTVDGDNMSGCIPFDQCKIINDNFNNI